MRKMADMGRASGQEALVKAGSDSMLMRSGDR